MRFYKKRLIAIVPNRKKFCYKLKAVSRNTINNKTFVSYIKHIQGGYSKTKQASSLVFIVIFLKNKTYLNFLSAIELYLIVLRSRTVLCISSRTVTFCLLVANKNSTVSNSYCSRTVSRFI